jgi:hypothetical protein
LRHREVAISGINGVLWALKLATGQALWQFKPPEPELPLTDPRKWLFTLGKWAAEKGWVAYAPTVLSPAIADEMVYVLIYYSLGCTVLYALN